MKVLVANLGSTSFKYRLLDMSTERQLALGGIERIGEAESRAVVEIDEQRRELTLSVPDHAAAVEQCLLQLTDPDDGCLADASEVAAIGFKAVHGGRVSGVQRVDDELLSAMEEMSQVAPAHNPPYIAAMSQLHERFPEIPLVAAFETGFHETIPERSRHYAIPHEWADQLPIRRWGFHGASHRYIANRTAELLGREDLRIISCHHLPLIMEATGKSLDEVLDDLACRSGLLGMSGVSGDLRDIQQAAAEGNSRAQLALEVFTTDIRRYLGALLVELGGADVIVFTGGIGENQPQVRATVCQGLEELGVQLDENANGAADGESCISDEGSRTQVWVIPTNEELIVARQVCQLLEG